MPLRLATLLFLVVVLGATRAQAGCGLFGSGFFCFPGGITDEAGRTADQITPKIPGEEQRQSPPFDFGKVQGLDEFLASPPPKTKPADPKDLFGVEAYNREQSRRGQQTAIQQPTQPVIPRQATSTAPIRSQPESIRVERYIPPSGHTFGDPTVQTVSLAPSYARPGGISLTKAAAERLALNLDIDSLYFREGLIVLSGARSSSTRIDAALFLTALRTACETTDPSFSLDPVDGEAWNQQAQMALKLVWDRIQDNFSWDSKTGPNEGRNRRIPNGFNIETISVKRDHPQLWSEIRAGYPELRAKLVFRPDWLSQTRFGDILYKADVLLKELTSGVSIVQPGVALRASQIPGYVSSDQRGIARATLTPNHLGKAGGWRGHRLWFDLMPQIGANVEPRAASENPDEMVDRRTHPDLYAEVKRRGFVGSRIPNPIEKTAFYTNGDVTDLSHVYPKMFVRRHDHVSGNDIPGHDPDLDLLSGDVNERTDRYANAYQELRDLTDVFRAYIASVKIVKQDERVCGTVRSLPLTSGEKVSSPLPDTHPTELSITVARYAWSEARGRRLMLHSGHSASGGISLRGKEFYPTAIVNRQTPITEEVHRELARGMLPAPMWKSQSGRQYIAFNLDPREPPPKVPIVATTK